MNRQTALYSKLKSECARHSNEMTFVYKSENLGYLPYAIYQWIEIGHQTLDIELPDGWCLEDIEALVAAGLLERYGEVEGNFQPEDYWAYFRLIQQ